MALKDLLPRLQENVVLAPYTSFKIGGPARYFVVAKTSQDIILAIQAAHKAKVPYFLLGGGTNLLISDAGYPGLVILMKNSEIIFGPNNTVTCGAGAGLQDCIDQSIEHNLGGMEAMSGIGGTVGGAVRGNAGAFGQTIGDRVVSVKALADGEVRTYTHEECGFSYRESFFKKNPLVILVALFQLVPGERATLRATADGTIKTRNQRYNVNWQCAGCVFKNIDLSKTAVDAARIMKVLEVTQEEYAQVTKFGKLPVSFITDRLGLKGQSLGGAKIAEEHGAFILNTGNAKAEDVVMLMSVIKTKVRNALGIQLEPEIELVGF